MLATIRELEGFSFVPVISVTVGIILTFVCLATLIYYIHDMSYAIQASSVIERSADDLRIAIKRLFPSDVGDGVPADPSGSDETADPDWKSVEESLQQRWGTATCDRIGYVQAIKSESILSLASEHGLVVRLLITPGDFVYVGSDLAEIYRGDGYREEGSDSLDSQAERICRCLILGSDRTPTQDVRYAFDELVEVAVRALSPGINDPFTALNCIEQIHASLHEMKRRKSPSPYRVDNEKRLRIIARHVSFEACLDRSRRLIQHYAKGSPSIQDRVAKAIAAFT